MRRIDLHSLRFGDSSEVWRTLPVEVAPFLYGGLEYRVPDDVVEADLTAARVGDNLTLSLAVDTRVLRPVSALSRRRRSRCARPEASSTSVTATPRPDDEDEPYVVAHQVDLERWVRDLIAEALPQKLLCRDDCRGLCPVCGADLNADPAPSARGSVSGGRMVQFRVWLT